MSQSATMEKVKLCVGCKHYEDNTIRAIQAAKYGVSKIVHLCSHPLLVDRVSGLAVDASDMRRGECGKEGRYWEPKG